MRELQEYELHEFKRLDDCYQALITSDHGDIDLKLTTDQLMYAFIKSGQADEWDDYFEELTIEYTTPVYWSNEHQMPMGGDDYTVKYSPEEAVEELSVWHINPKVLIEASKQ